MIVYSNSCSPGLPGQGHSIYPEMVAKDLGAELVYGGTEGSTNRRIFRTSVRDLIECQARDPDIVVLIGMTFLARNELWQPWLPANGNDGHFHTVEVDHKQIDWSIKGLIDTIVPDIHKLADRRVKDFYREWLIHYHSEAAVTELLTDMLMFAGWCRSREIQYLIFINPDKFPEDSKVGYNSPFLSSFMSEAEADPYILEPWNFSMNRLVLGKGLKLKDEASLRHHGHPDEQGHRVFAYYLLEKLKQ